MIFILEEFRNEYWFYHKVWFYMRLYFDYFIGWFKRYDSWRLIYRFWSMIIIIDDWFNVFWVILVGFKLLMEVRILLDLFLINWSEIQPISYFFLSFNLPPLTHVHLPTHFKYLLSLFSFIHIHIERLRWNQGKEIEREGEKKSLRERDNEFRQVITYDDSFL